MIFSDACKCGARRKTTTSVIAGNRGKLVEAIEPDGETTMRDTRNWRYS